MPQRATKLMGGGISAVTASIISGDLQDNVTATGSTQATAVSIYADITVVTTAAASTGVIIGGASFQAGDGLIVHNLGANAVLVYPPVGGQINALSVNAGFSVAAGKQAFIWARTGTTFVAGVTA
jgi:hypothetical protein